MEVIIIDLQSKHFRSWGNIVKKQKDSYLVELDDGQYLFHEKDLVKVDDYKDMIPSGIYCYGGTRAPGDKQYKVCPHWTMTIGGVGFCRLLSLSDGDDNVVALFDQIKECGINDEEVA